MIFKQTANRVQFSGHLVRLGLLVLLVPVFWSMYKYMFRHVTAIFNEPLESMSHGWLIPFVSVYALWVLRKRLKEAAGSPSPAGVFFVLLFLVVFWFGSRGGQSRIEQFSFIGLLWAVPYAFWGGGVARLLVFPVGYLLFTIPLSSFLDFFTVTLRLFSTSLVCGLMNGVGFEIQRVGNALRSVEAGSVFNLEVADGCSGIESFFAVMALTAAYAWLKQKTLLQKGILFLFAVPVAVIGNSARLASDCLVAIWFGQDAVGGLYHDLSGFAMAILDVFLVIQMSRLVSMLDKRIEHAGRIPSFLRRPMPSPRGKAGGNVVLNLSLPIVTFVLIVLACFSRYQITEPYYGEADFIARELPPVIRDFRSEVPLFCHNESCLVVIEVETLPAETKPGNEVPLKCPACGSPLYRKSLGETTDTPGDTVILKRNYSSGDGMTYNMNVVIGGRNRYSIHRAEQCLPAQGFLMEKTRTLALRLADGEEIKVRCIDASRKGSYNATLLYWFVSEEHLCSTHAERILLDVWDRSIHNRINRWIMFSVFIPSGLGSPESVERFEQFLSDFYPQVYLKEKRTND